jgi:GNAT superfamily N-acetyltransferase
MQSQVLIRRATARDAEAVAKLAIAQATEEGAPTALDADRVKTHGFGNNALFEVWVAQDGRNGPLVAHAIATAGYDVRRARPTFVLAALFVAHAHRRGGLARQMISAVARRARDIGARELMITTGVEDETAQRFFAAIGARRQDAAVFMLSADGIEWLAVEGT